MMSFSAMAQKHFDMKLWEGKTPNKNKLDDVAELKVFLPNEKKATGRAVVICPGGGYEHLAMEHEGTQWAPFFNNLGIAVVVLKYRMPNGNDEVPVSDAEEAMRTVDATPEHGRSTQRTWASWASRPAVTSPPRSPSTLRAMPSPTSRFCSTP